MKIDSQHEMKKQCLVCDSVNVEKFLDLGETALANQFLSADKIDLKEPKYPLRVGFCHECGHVQLMQAVPPLEMFENYLYISSASDTLKNHLWDLSEDVVRRYGLGAADRVIDIGCNDGTLLQGFRRYGGEKVGVDPAQNLAELAAASGIERYVGLFTAATAQEIVSRWGHAASVTATNTFPHIQNLGDFIQGLRTVLGHAACLSSRCTICLTLSTRSLSTPSTMSTSRIGRSAQ